MPWYPPSGERLGVPDFRAGMAGLCNLRLGSSSLQHRVDEALCCRGLSVHPSPLPVEVNPVGVQMRPHQKTSPTGIRFFINPITTTTTA